MNWDPRGLIEVHGDDRGEREYAVYHTMYLNSPYEVRMGSRPQRLGEWDRWLFDTLAAAQRFARERAQVNDR